MRAGTAGSAGVGYSAGGCLPHARARLGPHACCNAEDRMSQVQADTPTAARPVVSVEDLHVRFLMREATVAAINGVSFDLEAGQVLGILGESGSGKSVT